ncbi:hypothetical protein [Methylobacterium sp. A52T]
MSAVFSFVLEGAAGLVEPAWLRAQRAVAGASAAPSRQAAFDPAPGHPDPSDRA